MFTKKSKETGKNRNPFCLDILLGMNCCCTSVGGDMRKTGGSSTVALPARSGVLVLLLYEQDQLF